MDVSEIDDKFEHSSGLVQDTWGTDSPRVDVKFHRLA